MEFEATEIQEFNIYLKVAKVLLHDLDNLTDQTKAAQWVQTLGPGLPTRKYQTRLMLSYMKLLVCALLRKKLVEPFTNSPGTYLDEAYGNLKLTDMWLTVSKSAWLARSGGGEPSPCHVEVSGDRQQYACVQRAADGAQCYFAISAAQKLERWNNATKAHLPKVYKTDKTKIDLPPLPDLKPLPDDALLEQKLTQKDIQKAKDVLKRIKDRDATKKEQSSPPPSEAMDIPVTPSRRYSLPWDKIEAGIPPTMSPSDPEYVDMSRAKYPAGYIKDLPAKGGSMDWGRRRKYVQKPYSPEKSSGDERRVLENITEASVVEPTLGELSDLSHISQEELSLYDSFRDNLEDTHRKKVAFGDAKLYVPYDSMQKEMPEYRRPLSRISEKSESSIPRESMGQLIQSPLYTPKFPDSPSLTHLQRSQDTPSMFGSPDSLRSTPRSIPTPGSLPHTTGSFGHTPGSLPSTPGSYYPDSPGLLPYTPKTRQDESLRRKLMRSGMDSSQDSKDDSRDFYKKLGYSNIGAYLDGIMPETVPVVQESPVVDTPHDESWERRLAEVGRDEDRSFNWLGGGFFDMEDRDTEAQKESQAEFNRHLAGLENMIQVPESPTQDTFGPWVQEQQRRAYDASEEASVLATQPPASAISPRDRTTRRTRPTTLTSPALFRRGMGGRDRMYRPSEFGLTGEEHWTPAEAYFRGSIEPIFDPDERAVDRIIRFIDGSMLEDEGMDFSSVLDESVPDWERPSWPGLRFTFPQIHPNREGPMPVSPRHPSRERTHTEFDSNVLPHDILDESFDSHFSLGGLNTSVFDNVLENEPRSDPRTIFRRQELSDYENLEDETPLDIPIANASVDDSSTSDQSEIPSHLWASELHRLKSTWEKLQGNVSNQLTESHLEIQDESFPHSEFIQTLPSVSTSPDTSHLQFQDESFPYAEFIQTSSSIAGSPDRSYRQLHDESFPHSEFIQTPSSKAESLDRSYLQFEDESFPHSEFIQTPSSITASLDRSHLQFQDESFPYSEFIQTPSSIPSSFNRSYLQFQDESFPHSEFIQTLPSTDESFDRSHLQFQDESFPYSEFIQTSSSIAESPERIGRSPPHYPSVHRRQSQSSGAIQERVIAPRRSSSAPAKGIGSSTQTDYGLDAQWDRLLQGSQINLDDEELPSFKSITEDSLPQNETNFNVSNDFMRDIESQLIPEPPLLPEILEPGIDDLSAISLVLDESATLGDGTFANSTMISATSPPQFFTAVDESYPTDFSTANISSTSIPKLMSSFDDDSQSIDFRRIHGTPESAKNYIPSPFELPSLRRVEVKKQHKILPGTENTTTRYTGIGSGQYSGKRRHIPRSQIRPRRITFETSSSMGQESPGVRMLEDESDLQFVDDFSYAPSVEMRSPGLRMLEDESDLQFVDESSYAPSVEIRSPALRILEDESDLQFVDDFSYASVETRAPGLANRISISPRVHARSNLHYDLQLPDMSGELLDNITAPSFRTYESSGLPNESMLSAETQPSYPTYIDRSISGNISRETPLMISSYIDENTPEMISLETPPSFNSYEDNSLLQYSRNRPNDSMPTPTRRRIQRREHTGTSSLTPRHHRVPALIHRTPESAKHYIPPPVSLPSLVRYEQKKPYRNFAAPAHSTPKFSLISTQSRPPSVPQRTIIPRRLNFTQEESSFPEPTTRIPLLENESQPEFAISYDGSSLNMDSKSLGGIYGSRGSAGILIQDRIGRTRLTTLTDPNYTQMLEDETAPDFVSSYNQSGVGSVIDRSQEHAVPSTNESQRRNRSRFSVSNLSSKQMLEDETAPDFASSYDQSIFFGQGGSLSLPDGSSFRILEDETMPTFPSSYYNQSSSFDQRGRLSLQDQSSVRMLDEETMPSFSASYYDQSASSDTRRRFSLPDQSSIQMLDEETMPSFAPSYYDRSVSSDTRRRLPLPDQSSIQMLDEETMPSFAPSYYDQSASSDTRRRLSLPDQSSIQMLDEETMPSFAPSYYDQSASFDTRRRLSLPDQSSVQMLDDETMPSFRSSYYDQSASLNRRRLSLPNRSPVQMLDEETMPSFQSSFDQSTSFDGRRLSLPNRSPVQMLDEETMPSFQSSFDQSASFDGRRLSLPNRSPVQMLDEETMPSFQSSFDQSASSDVRRLSLPNRSPLQMLDEETMPSFQSSFDQSASFDGRRLSLLNRSPVQMLDEETMPSFPSTYYDQPASFDTSRLLSLADQSSVQMLDEEEMPSFASSYYDQSSVHNRGRLSQQDQSSLRMLDQESMPSFASSYNQSRNLTLPDLSFVERLEDETEPYLASSYESSCGNKSCRKDSIETQMLEDESQPYFDSSYSESLGYPDSSRDNSQRLVNRSRDRRRRPSPRTRGHLQTSSRQIRDSPRMIIHPSFTEEQLNDITPPSLYMRQSSSIPDESKISNESPYYYSSFDSVTPTREMYNNLQQRRRSSNFQSPPNRRVVSTPKTPESFRKYVKPPFTLPSPVRFQTPDRNAFVQGSTSTPQDRFTFSRRTQTRRGNRNDLSLPQLLETDDRLIQDETDPNLITTFDSDIPSEYIQRANFIPEYRQIHRTPRRIPTGVHWTDRPDVSGEQLDDISDRILSTSTFTINDASTPRNLSQSQCTICPGNSQIRAQGTREGNYLYRDENYVPFDETNALSPFHGIDSTITSDDLSSINTSREYSFFD